jgi:DNA-binding IclR family transcriptional regulator
LRETTSDKVLKVLELFGGDRVVWTVEEAAEALNLPTSTTYRYFRSLAKSELITTYVPGRYVLGPAIIEYDRQMRLYDPLITASHAEMLNLAKRTGEPTTILLTRLYHHRIMCVHLAQLGTLPFSLGYERGRRMPLVRGAAGKVVLAHLSNRALAELLATQPEINQTDMDKLKDQLRQIRLQGFAMTEQEIEKGARGMSVPIFSLDQRIEGSLSVVVPMERRDITTIVEQLIRARKAIEANLAIGVLDIQHDDADRG